MPSVAARVLVSLHARLLAIRGQCDMVNDLQGRAHMQRFSYDMDIETAPAVFIARRTGSGTREQKPGASDVLSDTTVIYDVVGVVKRTPVAALEGEGLLADLQRALELPADPYLLDSALSRNLLSQELRIVDPDLEPPPDGVGYDVVGLGVQCTWPHKYGDPDHVA